MIFYIPDSKCNMPWFVLKKANRTEYFHLWLEKSLRI